MMSILPDYTNFHKVIQENQLLASRQETYSYRPRDCVQYTVQGLKAARTRTKTHARYLEKGIKFCWDDIYRALEDVGIRPKGTSLDRINGHGNYEIGNVWWADTLAQRRNKISNRYYKSLKSGEIKCIAHWSDDMGINPGTFKKQIEHPDIVEVEYLDYVVQELTKHANKPLPYLNGTFFKCGDQDLF